VCSRQSGRCVLQAVVPLQPRVAGAAGAVKAGGMRVQRAVGGSGVAMRRARAARAGVSARCVRVAREKGPDRGV